MLQQTTFGGNDPRQYPRADLIKDEFEALIYEKGREVIVEQAIMCPCKSPASNQQSTCKNCGGTGWAFINARQTRMVLTGIDAVSKNFGWSEEVRGMMNVSCAASEEITYMDRITLLAGIALYQEVLFVKQYGSTYFSYASYKIRSIAYIAIFRSTTQTYERLVEGTDYTFEGNAMRFISTKTKVVEAAITIRYKHAPTYHIVEMKRETMESFRMTEAGEKLQHMPLSAYARRAHYILDAQNLAGDRILSNSYLVECSSEVCQEEIWRPCIPSGSGGEGSSTNFIIGEIPFGVINGSNATFTTVNDFKPESVEVFLNGQRQTLIVDYNTSGLKTVILYISPQPGDVILVNYIKQ